jgi:hypothetical protein
MSTQINNYDFSSVYPSSFSSSVIGNHHHGDRTTVEEYSAIVQKLTDYYFTLIDPSVLYKDISHGSMNFMLIKNIPELLSLLKNVKQENEYSGALVWSLFSRMKKNKYDVSRWCDDDVDDIDYDDDDGDTDDADD